jgi:hypothetical protein
MMCRILIIIILFQILSSGIKAQISVEDRVYEVEQYRCNSNELRELISTLADTCHTLYNCDDLRKLRFSPSNLFDSIGEIDVRAILLIENGDLKNRIYEGEVVLMIDSITIMVQKGVLFNSCLNTSLEYLGKSKFDLKYEKFESCLHQYGVVFTMKFSCLTGMNPNLHYYGAYLPLSGKKNSIKL